MATIEGAPPYSTVIALRGVLDYACWRGRYYVRSWPRKSTIPQTPASAAASAAFAAIGRAVPLTDPILQAQWAKLGLPNWTWRDLAISAMYGNIWPDEP